MAELSRNFLKGRMNKDFDERIVPNGEYRDALNLQIATSEDSNIGAAQNLKGNAVADGGNFMNFSAADHDNALTVGSYADESNKKIYNFIHKASDLVANGVYNGLTRFTGIISDCIVEYSTNTYGQLLSPNPIITDVFETRRVASVQSPNNVGVFDLTKISGLLEYNNGFNFLPLGVRLGMRVQLIGPDGIDAYGEDNRIYVKKIVSSADEGQSYIRVNPPLGGGAIPYSQNLIDSGYVFRFTSERVLNFMPGSLEAESNTDGSLTNTPRNNIITAINKLDDILYFTDSRNEPKRISLSNFQRTSYKGAPPGIKNHSRLNYLNDNGARLFYDLKREHITVIRPNPLTSPDISIESSFRTPTFISLDGNLTFFQYSSAVSSIIYENSDGFPVQFNLQDYQAGSEFYIFTAVQRVHWKVNDIIDIVGQNTGLSAAIKITEAYNTAANFGGGDTFRSFKITVVNIEKEYSDLENPQEELWFGTLREKESIYEKDFISFAYRYKYLNDEYSAIGPYSTTAFSPGPYNYSAKEGFNEGMISIAKKITVSNFVASTVPNDVVEVELIFKDHNSTTAKVIRSFNRDSVEWNFNTIDITTEVFGNNLPSQQLTRVFDNVPRKANAQEFVGNRLMFGNYLENYNLKDSSLGKIKPIIQSNIVPLPTQFGSSSDLVDLTASQDTDATYPFGGLPFPAEGINGLEPGVPDAMAMVTSGGANTHIPGNPIHMAVSHFNHFQNTIDGDGSLIVPANIENDPLNAWNNLTYQYTAFGSGEYTFNCTVKIALGDGVLAPSSSILQTVPIKLGLYNVLPNENVTEGGALASVTVNVDQVQTHISFSYASGDVYTSINLQGTANLSPGTYAFYLSGFSADYNDGSFLISLKDTIVEIGSPNSVDPGVANLALPSVKSVRSYNIGVVYLDRYGRESTVMFDPSENLFNEKSNSNKQNRIECTVFNQAPYWATHYKFFVKELASEYYNVVLYKAYFNDNEGLYAWLSFNSSDRNKIKIDDYLIQKKRHGNQIAVHDDNAKWRVLDIVGTPETTTDDEEGLGPITGINLGNANFDASNADISGKFFVKIQINEEFIQHIGNSETSTDVNNINQGACFEVETKNNNELDLFYEASMAYPIRLNDRNVKDIIKPGMKLKLVFVNVHSESFVSQFNEADIKVAGVKGALSFGSNQRAANSNFEEGHVVVELDSDIPGGIILPEQKVKIVKEDGSYIVLKTSTLCPVNKLYFIPYTHKADANGYTSQVCIPWYNCFAFNNGVESDRIRDDFNAKTIYSYTASGKISGFKASIPNEDYREQRQGSKIIFSQVKNESVGLNRTNEFLMAEPIVKSLNPEYGTIQKLYTRDNDLISFCESKVLRVLANKDALFNADGDPQLISSTNVLGQALPYTGDYGISKNPESFAVEEYRIYFADRDRGAVCRLSRDGITAISDAGMKDWFNDNLKEAAGVVGSYDGKKNEYNITIHSITSQMSTKNVYTVSYTEDVKGWTSFRSYIKESGLSLANSYYTFKNGRIYIHDSDDAFLVEPYNNFYGVQYTSSITPIFNDDPSAVKSFAYINYEGTQSKVNAFTTVEGETDSEYYNLSAKNGWSVELINTDKQEGTVSEFIEKEGKWFNYIKGIETSYTNAVDGGSVNNNLDFNEITIQGIGSLANNTIVIDGSETPSEGFDVDLDFI